MDKQLSLGGIALLLSFFVSSCGTANPSESSSGADSEATSASALMDNNSLVPINDTRRKMMKSADIDMRVEDVRSTTVKLERIVNQLGGLVIKSQLENQSSETKELPYSADSIKLAKVFVSSSYLEVKVPAIALDSFLAIAADQAQFIQSRNLQLQDASIEYLGNQMKSRTGATTIIDKAKYLSKNTEDALDVADFVQKTNDKNVVQKLSNVQIDDQVKYASVCFAITQPAQVDFVVVANVQKKMQAGFGTQFFNGLSFGWDLFKQLLLGLVYIWPLLLISLALVIGIKKRKQLIRK